MTDSTRGVWYMFLATFLFALMTVFVKLLPDIPVLEIIFFRALISLFLSWYGLMKARVEVWGNNKVLLIARGLAGVIALTMNFYLIQEVPLATASLLIYLAPIFTTLLGIIFVNEKVSPLQFIFFAISFAGVLVIQGFDPRISLLHLLTGVVASLFMGLAYNCVRKLGKTEHPLVIIFYFPLMCLPITGIWSALHWVQPQGWDWLIILMVGISTQMAQYYMTRSYQLAEISTVSIVNFTGIVYSLGMGFIFFGEYFNLVTYLGMALVLVGVILNVLFKSRLKWRKL